MECNECGETIMPPYVPPYDDKVYTKIIFGYPMEVCKECYEKKEGMRAENEDNRKAIPDEENL